MKANSVRKFFKKGIIGLTVGCMTLSMAVPAVVHAEDGCIENVFEEAVNTEEANGAEDSLEPGAGPEENQSEDNQDMGSENVSDVENNDLQQGVGEDQAGEESQKQGTEEGTEEETKEGPEEGTKERSGEEGAGEEAKEGSGEEAKEGSGEEAKEGSGEETREGTEEETKEGSEKESKEDSEKQANDEKKIVVGTVDLNPDDYKDIDLDSLTEDELLNLAIKKLKAIYGEDADIIIRGSVNITINRNSYNETNNKTSGGTADESGKQDDIEVDSDSGFGLSDLFDIIKKGADTTKNVCESVKKVRDLFTDPAKNIAENLTDKGLDALLSQAGSAIGAIENGSSKKEYAGSLPDLKEIFGILTKVKAARAESGSQGGTSQKDSSESSQSPAKHTGTKEELDQLILEVMNQQRSTQIVINKTEELQLDCMLQIKKMQEALALAQNNNSLKEMELNNERERTKYMELQNAMKIEANKAELAAMEAENCELELEIAIAEAGEDTEAVKETLNKLSAEYDELIKEARTRLENYRNTKAVVEMELNRIKEGGTIITYTCKNMTEVNNITSSRNDVHFVLIDTIVGGENITKFLILNQLNEVHQYFLVGYVKPQN